MGKSQSKLLAKEIKYLKDITHFNKTELQQRYKSFLKDFPSGQLDNTQFRQIYRDFFLFGDPVQFADHIFYLFDKNGNGTIDFMEFICALSVISLGELDEKLKWAFRLYDLNVDGYITYGEILHIVQSIYCMIGGMLERPSDEDTPEKRVDKIFRSMGVDKDSRMTFDQFVEASKRDASLVQVLSLQNCLLL